MQNCHKLCKKGAATFWQELFQFLTSFPKKFHCWKEKHLLTCCFNFPFWLKTDDWVVWEKLQKVYLEKPWKKQCETGSTDRWACVQAIAEKFSAKTVSLKKTCFYASVKFKMTKFLTAFSALTCDDFAFCISQGNVTTFKVWWKIHIWVLLEI